jgi:two-component system, cell cycle response regulator
MSVKLKLVAYFVLLALLPLAAAFVGFGAVVARAETRVVDAQLGATLRAVEQAYEEELAAAERVARGAAANLELQRALATFDVGELQRLLEGRPSLRVIVGEVEIGGLHAYAAERRVAVVPAGAELGSGAGIVVASVPLDAALLERLARRAGAEAHEELVLVSEGHVVAGAGLPSRPLAIAAGAGETVDLAGTRYRAVGSPLSDGGGVALAVLAPAARISAAAAADRFQLLFALGTVLALVALVAYLQGRAIVAAVDRLVKMANALAAGRLDERAPEGARDEFGLLARSFNEMAEQLQGRLEELETERRRLREITARFAGALSATHDVDQLLLAIVETAVEATGATRGVLMEGPRKLVQVGSPGPAPDRIELPLGIDEQEYGQLVLLGRGFSALDVGTAELLVGHASVALENARLHRIVERQSLVDDTTELANRRRAEVVLRGELARAARHGGSVSVVVADLDGFKDVNDRFGHPCGDGVLREFARILRDSVREIDLAARWGGEEFVLVLAETDAAGAACVAERVRAAVAERPMLTPTGLPFAVTASFGVAAAPPESTVEGIIAAADAALYSAKRGGKNRVVTAEERASVA